MATSEPLVSPSDVKAWRDGGWVFVRIGAEILFRRYTRDRAFTHAVVIFSERCSPPLPQTRSNLARIELGGAWRPRIRWTPNRLHIPITKEN